MIATTALILAISIVSLLALIVLPSSHANANVRGLRLYVTYVLGAQILFALLLAVGIALQGGETSSIPLASLSQEIGIGLTTYVDGTSSLMLLMVSIVAFVVSRYSIRYLDGEAMQGRYFRWLGFAAGAVSLMVIAGNALLFVGAWMMTSFGLHQLLLHYRHRKAAHHAAWTKFAISRLGDAFLIAALVLIYQTFGTFDFASLFQQAKEVTESGTANWSQVAIGWLIMFGAVTKSAQFPFHTWLPSTMETPTPVSALMHAGIVNAGGYLIIRTSPLVAMAPSALVTLAAIGGFTAFFASVVMMTQPSIKRSLAYSTVAQMGFMMLQCGFGAFSAAMLHILAHSFYKAHAFLSSGSVITESQTRSAPEKIQPAKVQPANQHNVAPLIASALLSIIAFASAGYILGVDLTAKSGGLTLAFILCLALTTWGWRLILQAERQTITIAAAGVSILSLAYLACYSAISALVTPSAATIEVSAAMQFVMLDVSLAFAALFVLHIALRKGHAPQWLEPLRIHASNGFYIDAVYRRLFGGLLKS